MFANAFAGFGLGVDNAHSTDNMSVVNAFVESDNDTDDDDTDDDDAQTSVLIDDHAPVAHTPIVPPTPTLHDDATDDGDADGADDTADDAAPHVQETQTETIDVVTDDGSDGSVDTDDAATTSFDASDNDPDATQLTD